MRTIVILALGVIIGYFLCKQYPGLTAKVGL